MTSSPSVTQYRDANETHIQEPVQSANLNQAIRPDTCLKLKGSLVPMTVLELSHYDKRQISIDLETKTKQAPGFFENLPVVIDLEKLMEHEQIPFADLIDQCLGFSIKVVAIRGGQTHHQESAKAAGLGTLPKQKEKTPHNISNVEPTEAAIKEVETVEVTKTVIQTERQQSKVVHNPIRSGQQVYAADGDLIVLASVSAGAEILADGNIHVYGALRGRALAGVKGDTSARIFCHSLEAELVSIAGQYKISEDIDKSVLRKSTQVYLNDDSLSFKELEK